MTETAADRQKSSGLGDIVIALRRHTGVIVLCVVLTAGAALGVSLAQTARYTAEASLLFRDPGFDQRLFGAPVFQAGSDPAREAATNVRLVSLDVVADATASDVDRGLSGEEVSELVSVEEQGQSDVVTVAATDPDPAFAAYLANTFSRNFIEFRVHADRAKIKDAIHLVRAQLDRLDPEALTGSEGNELRSQLSKLETLAALQTGNAELVQPATRPESPSSPATVRNTALGAILGLMLGIGLALIFERLDRRVRTTSELEEIFELPLLVSVPESDTLAKKPEGSPLPLPFAEAEAFRMLRTRLRYFNVDRHIRSVLVTSAVPGEGKSTLSWNLALATAASGQRTVLVEADLHHQTFAEAAHLSPLPGLSEVISQQIEFQAAIQMFRTQDQPTDVAADGALSVLVGGATPPNPAELLDSEEMVDLLRELADSYDFVVLDTPPATVLADAIPLMKRVDGVIVVSRLGQTSRDEAKHLRDQLRNLGITPLGIAANRVTTQAAQYGYGYYDRSASGKSRPRARAGSQS